MPEPIETKPAQPVIALDPAARRLVLAGLVIGVWAALPPLFGPELNTELADELVDHALPALIVLGAVAATTLPTGPTGRRLLYAGLAVTAAGWFMVVTHVPLVGQAYRDDAPWAGTIHHSLPPLAVLMLGLVWVAIARRQSAER